MSTRAILQSGVLSMLALAAPVSAQSEGDRAELIHARDWFHWIGEEPRLEDVYAGRMSDQAQVDAGLFWFGLGRMERSASAEEGEQVEIDFNRPLAGQQLGFRVEILDVQVHAGDEEAGAE